MYRSSKLENMKSVHEILTYSVAIRQLNFKLRTLFNAAKNSK